MVDLTKFIFTKILVSLFPLLLVSSANAQKLNYELGLGLGYQPKFSKLHTGGMEGDFFSGHGFVSIQLNGTALYNVHPRWALGTSLIIRTMPQYIATDVTNTTFYSNYGDEYSAQSNLQSTDIMTDLGLVVRRNFILNANSRLFIDIIPSLSLNNSRSLEKAYGKGEDSVFIEVYYIQYDPPSKLDFAAHMQVGIQKKRKKNYYNLCLFYSRSAQPITGKYVSMRSEPEFNYGTIRLINQQVGIKFILGFGKWREPEK